MFENTDENFLCMYLHFWGAKSPGKCWHPKLIFPSNYVANKYGVRARAFFVTLLLGFCTSLPAAFHQCPTLPQQSFGVFLVH